MRKYCNIYPVIGLGFGDEGKGLTVNSLCSQLPDVMVVRFSGGQQAGHTVTLPDGTSHVFSNFGSGALHGSPTYWSRFCTFDPVGVINEFNVLSKLIKTYDIKLYVDENSPVTTPFDKYHNRRRNKELGHGTCGVGVGATYEREEKFYSLLARDLLYPSVLSKKLSLIGQYYEGLDVPYQDISNFLTACKMVTEVVDIRRYVPKATNYVFEGSQGLMLDPRIGFFPHVTRSNLGSTNILQFCQEQNLSPEIERPFLITRAFQTRHGNGPMTNDHIPHNIKKNPKETNVPNPYQGEFRTSLLDLDLVAYALKGDSWLNDHWNKQLVVTCLDLVKGEHRYTVNDGKIVGHPDENSFVNAIASHLNIDRVYKVSSPDTVIDFDFR